jgi:hypothetical protein
MAETKSVPADGMDRIAREETFMSTLSGKNGLITGIANEHSLAHGCARHFHAAGAELAITYLNVKAEPYVRTLATCGRAIRRDDTAVAGPTNHRPTATCGANSQTPGLWSSDI